MSVKDKPKSLDVLKAQLKKCEHDADSFKKRNVSNSLLVGLQSQISYLKKEISDLESKGKRKIMVTASSKK